MSRTINGKIKINSFADLVCGDETAIVEVPLVDLYPFKDHPFKVLDDEKMEETVDSIRKYGVLMPGIVRPRMDGGYEIIAGHRRKRACEIVGLQTMPVVVKRYTDDQAVVAMVDTNIQREDILPSEKAHAYRMKYEALKHQGAEGGSSLEEIGDMSGESAKTVQRYINLSRLSGGLLDLVDEKRLPLRSGLEISFMSDRDQDILLAVIVELNVLVTPMQAKKIRSYSENNELTKALAREILSDEKPKSRSVSFKADTINQFFDDSYSNEDIVDTTSFYRRFETNWDSSFEDLYDFFRDYDREILLVLPLTEREDYLEYLVDHLATKYDYSLVFTKLDEIDCRDYFSVLNFYEHMEKPVKYLTDGPNIPDDFRIFDVKWLFESILKDKKK